MNKKMMLVLIILLILAGCQQSPSRQTLTPIASETVSDKPNDLTSNTPGIVDSTSYPENNVETTPSPKMIDLMGELANETMQARLTAQIEKAVEDNKFQGSICIRLKDKILFDECYGLADRQTQRLHDDGTQYMIASMSKQFTAMCIMILEERGLLSASDTLDKYFEDFVEGQNVTIHHLLTHTSGLPAFVSLGEGRSLQDQISSAIKKQKIVFNGTPGTNYVYSDTGYVLLSAIIEIVSGEKYEVFLQQNILDTLELHNTGFGYDHTINPGLAVGYGPDGAQLADPSSVASLRYGAGAMYTTVNDFDKWLKALCTNSLVNDRTLQKMYTRFADIPGTSYGYGYGFFVDDVSYKHKIVFHGGRLISKTFTGFSIMCPELNISIVVLGNDSYHDEKMDLAFSCLQTLLNTLEIDYMGQTPPGTTPVKFAPGIVSDSQDELNGVFTPSGDQFFYTVRNGWEEFKIYYRSKVKDGWSEAKPVPFASNALDADPFISYDGQKLYFCSTRKMNDQDTTDDWNIWVSLKADNQWQDPVPLSFNTELNEMYVSVTKTGDIYFHTDYQAASAQMDLYCSKYRDGAYSTPENLGPALNSATNEYDPMIAPDGSFIIFTSTRKSNADDGDLYIAFSDENGVWKTAINMGSDINSPYFDYCPSLSPDAQYLFFTSYRNYNQSLGDIYWVNSDIINRLNGK